MSSCDGAERVKAGVLVSFLPVDTVATAQPSLGSRIPSMTVQGSSHSALYVLAALGSSPQSSTGAAW